MPDRIKKIGDMFSSNGGVQLGALLEGLASNEFGKEILEKFTGNK